MEGRRGLFFSLIIAACFYGNASQSTDCKTVKLADIVFIVDESGSITTPSFQLIRAFLHKIVEGLDVSPNRVRVGIVLYSDRPTAQVYLNNLKDKNEILQIIMTLPYRGGGTNTGAALRFAQEKIFIKDRGSRKSQGVQQVAVVITDGKSQDAVSQKAADLRRAGVTVYAVGIKDANKTELVQMASYPSKKHVFIVDSFAELKTLEQSLQKILCHNIIRQALTASTRELAIKEGCKQTNEADIFFLMDHSGSIYPNDFNDMKEFIKEFIHTFHIGPQHVRMGVAKYADSPNLEFDLTTYSDATSLEQAVDNIKQTGGGTQTGAALSFIIPKFERARVTRSHQVPEYLVVITDGKSSDNVKAPAEKLRANGTIIYAIGVKNANETELEEIAGSPTVMFSVNDFDALKHIKDKILTDICFPNPDNCSGDIMFLIDCSESIDANSLQKIKNFMKSVVQNIHIGRNQVHMGVMQFSTGQTLEFPLNRYYDKDIMSRAIDAIQQRKGGTSTGAAIRKVSQYFSAAEGGRPHMKQRLVVITDGEAQDKVKGPAEALRASGVVIYAIGVANTNRTQLKEISGSQERLYVQRDFDALMDLESEFSRELCDPGEGCTIDIAMGFDISQRTGAPGEVLVSGQPKLQRFLQEIVRYVSTIQGLCCTGTTPIKPKIAFRVVGQDGRPLYDSNFEEYNEDVVRKVMNVQMSQATYFNTALLQSFKDKFMSQSNAGVKVLLIFSDGLNEDVMKLEQESELLRKSGVHALLTVALERVHDAKQLQMVEFGRGFGYKLPLSIGMHSVGSTILKQIDTVADRECCDVICKCFGQEGHQGSAGPLGPKGVPGPKGHAGFRGEDGVDGERGAPGPRGPPGDLACPGTRGQKGYRGHQGNRGDGGENGLDGVDGEQGATGADGAAGERGHPGNPGIKGLRGEAGLKGHRGLRGDPGKPGANNIVGGPKGDMGRPGLPGDPGEDGPGGQSGTVGNPGPVGRRGPAGPKGSKGQPGDPGVPGSPGTLGPQGGRGVRGHPGQRGLPGLPGPPGQPGRIGGPGSIGNRGATGQRGQPGDPGVQGVPGSLGPRGLQGQDGRDGYGPAGPKGTKGDPGFPGNPGLQGENGNPGTKGFPGRKGSRGRGRNAGRKGGSGVKGDPGPPGHRGPRGLPGNRNMTECQLITYIRDNCVCCRDQVTCPHRIACPAYPTELVFGLDMSEDVTPDTFERMRSALISLLLDITIAESNCPAGARIAVVGYSAYTKYLIRFQDYQSKKKLVEAVQSIALERTTSRRHLGAAMRYVGLNVFKRVRQGMRMRKVAIFFSNGPSQDTSDILTAVMEYRAFNIVPVVVSLRSSPRVQQALEADDTGNSIFTVLGRSQNLAAELSRVKHCVICYDPCRPLEECKSIQEVPKPQAVDMDLAMVLDSSWEVQVNQYVGAQQLLGSVVEQLAVSRQPSQSDGQARVAMVQQTGQLYGQAPLVGQVAKLEFGLQGYRDRTLMKRHLVQSMHQQGGPSALGHTLEFALREVLLKATRPRRNRVLLAVVGSETAYWDLAKLHYISEKAKCQGVALFVMAVGERYNQIQVEQLASLPLQQHLIYVGHLKPEEQGYAQRFFRVFLNVLNRGMNTYPPASLKRICDQLENQHIIIDSGGLPSTDDGELEESAEESDGQTGVETQHNQLDVINTVSRGNGPSIASKPNLTSQCELDSDSGTQCADYVQQWFFDKAIGACSPFWYGGCGGNANRFNTENECFLTCRGHKVTSVRRTEQINVLSKEPTSVRRTEQTNVLSKEVTSVLITGQTNVLSKAQCELDADPGTQCADYVQQWFFDKAIGACSPFWYGGCGGNGNRFNTENECFLTCRGHKVTSVRRTEQTNVLSKEPTSVRRTEQTNVLSKAQCELVADSGTQCADYVQQWFFDKAIGACSPFWYGGCGGNANRFNTENECFLTCRGHKVTSVRRTEQINVLSKEPTSVRRTEQTNVLSKEVTSVRRTEQTNVLSKEPTSVRRTEQTNVLSKAACSLSQDTGSCQNYTMMWFFDNRQSKCSRFWYGGCGGNANRFKTRKECESLCLTESQ